MFCGSKAGADIVHDMGRPPLSLGTAGRVRSYRMASGWRSRTTYRDPDGVTREVQRTGRTKAASERALAEALRDRSRSAGAGSLTPDSPLKLAAEAWYADGLPRWRPTTAEAYRRVLDHHVTPGVGALRVRELSVARADGFLRAVGAGHGAATAKLARSVLSGTAAWCARRDLLDRNPVRDTTPVPTTVRRAPRALTVEQARDLMAWLTYDDVAIGRDMPLLVALMLATGCRIGEALALLWRDVDVEAPSVSIVANVVRTKAGLVRQEDESSKLNPRVLELPGWAADALRARQGSPQSPVLASSTGTLRDPANARRALREAFARAGYEWATSHTLRRTVATLMGEAGLTARAAADQLGHARPSMTQDRYLGRRATTGAAGVLELLGD